jgi:hypothetical protein
MANHFISLDQAIGMTTLYREEKENILIPELREQNILAICETFDRAAFDALLAQDGCEGIRIYYGMEEGLKVRAIFVGVNEENEDMLPSGEGLESTEGNNIVEAGQVCPVLCPPPSPLNGE